MLLKHTGILGADPCSDAPGDLGHIGGGQLQHLSAFESDDFRYPRPSTIRISRVTPPSSAASASL